MTKYNKNNGYYKAMCERVGEEFDEWLYRKYWDEELNSRDIAEIVYNKRKNGPNITRWMKKLEVPTRGRSSAVALQWKDNPTRVTEHTQRMKRMWVKDTDNRIRNKIIKVMQSEEYRRKQSESKMGERNGMWNPNLTEEDRMHTRNYRDYKEFKDGVLKRDGYTCIRCQSKRVDDLVVHHINGYHWDEGSRTEIDNGATLCEKCHKEFHSIYGYGNNDLFQFAQFMDLTLTK